MKLNIAHAAFAGASLLAIPTAIVAAAIPNAEDRSTNIARVTYNDDQVINMTLPANGDLVYEEISPAQTDIRNAMVHADISVRCFFWRQDRQADSVKNWGDNYMSWSFSKVLRQPFSQAERLFCYDNSADKTDQGDDSKEGTFTLFVENRKGQQELVRVSVPGGAVQGELDLVSDHDDPELRINVVRAALVDVPRQEGVAAGGVYESAPQCHIVSTPTQMTPTDLYRVAVFHPYLNILGIVCFRAGYPMESVWGYSWSGSDGNDPK